ncbi:TPA: hypothetical protein HA274_06885 [Candidatus Bathyarchaeota archaeon]|nr:hypothetical protein [Candidatus Bathyarchaeota archaeon]
MNRIVAILLILVIVASAFSALYLSNLPKANVRNETAYVGVAFQGETVAEAKLLIDRVKNYTNVFVLGHTPVSRDEASTNEVCDYAVSQGLNIIVNFGYYDPYASTMDQLFRRWPWQHTWVEAAKTKYGDEFLGVYYDDEPGGIQLDWEWSEFFFENYTTYFTLTLDTPLHQIYQRLIDANASGLHPENYDIEAEYFTETVFNQTRGHIPSGEAQVTTFTSDYALYWFDYLSGYDVILAQIGWNHTLEQDIALLRGAATMQNKTWGTIITWKYTSTPYLDSGAEVYKQMVASYSAGAKYILIFNYPKLDGNDYGIMQEEHFAALEKFWKDYVNPRRNADLSQGQVALILPRNYGWGMRNPDDKIWGMWGPDDKSHQIWSISRQLLSIYGLRLDIIYDDPAFPASEKYSKVYFWNETF